MFRLHPAIVLALIITLAQSAAQVTAAANPAKPLAVELGEKEITISASTAGTFSLTYPALVTKGDKAISAVRIAKDAGGVNLVYAGGGKGRVQLDQNAIKIAFSDLPADVNKFRMEMLIPITFGGSGTYALGGAAAQTFPAKNRPSPSFTKAMPIGWKSFTRRAPVSASPFRLTRFSNSKTIASGIGHFQLVVREPHAGRQPEPGVHRQDRSGRRRGTNPADRRSLRPIGESRFFDKGESRRGTATRRDAGARLARIAQRPPPILTAGCLVPARSSG